jgi:hypothetical protein
MKGAAERFSSTADIGRLAAGSVPEGTEATVEHPTPVDLAPFTTLRREPTRPEAYRGRGFDAEYDATTLLFDAFWDVEGRRLMLLGPPLLNLGKAFDRAEIVACPTGASCSFRRLSLNRHDRITVKAPSGTTELLIKASFGTVRVKVGVNRSELFAQRRVLLTLSKDNPIEWVLDWVRFHRDVHGADAVLFYDNGSTIYTPDELRRALCTLTGIASVHVVSWPFKYGPQTEDPRFWDSDYCQHGALEHARWRYLALARSVMNGDIDELVLAYRGESVFEAAERSLLGLMRYPGAWVMSVDGHSPAPGGDVRHRDFDIRLRPRPTRRLLLGRSDADACPPKWTVVPARCPDRAQWRAHRIAGWMASYIVTRKFGFRHFRPINTNWKYNRAGFEPFDPSRHIHDDVLAEIYAQVRWEV